MFGIFNIRLNIEMTADGIAVSAERAPKEGHRPWTLGDADGDHALLNVLQKTFTDGYCERRSIEFYTGALIGGTRRADDGALRAIANMVRRRFEAAEAELKAAKAGVKSAEFSLDRTKVRDADRALQRAERALERAERDLGNVRAEFRRRAR